MSQYTLGYRVKHSAARFGSILPWFLLVGLVVWGLWFAFNKPTQQVVAQKGSRVTVIEKPSRFFIPFVEAGISQKSNSELATEIRVGIRVEF
ncbi:MAG: hypothetical protein QME16_00010 [Planctomycetota bacterium]|nr:hypothetical protein [Planctomycetota bacterium]